MKRKKKVSVVYIECSGVWFCGLCCVKVLAFRVCVVIRCNYYRHAQYLCRRRCGCKTVICLCTLKSIASMYGSDGIV